MTSLALAHMSTAVTNTIFHWARPSPGTAQPRTVDQGEVTGLISHRPEPRQGHSCLPIPPSALAPAPSWPRSVSGIKPEGPHVSRGHAEQAGLGRGPRGMRASGTHSSQETDGAEHREQGVWTRAAAECGEPCQLPGPWSAFQGAVRCGAPTRPRVQRYLSTTLCVNYASRKLGKTKGKLYALQILKTQTRCRQEHPCAPQPRDQAHGKMLLAPREDFTTKYDCTVLTTQERRCLVFTEVFVRGDLY